MSVPQVCEHSAHALYDVIIPRVSVSELCTIRIDARDCPVRTQPNSLMCDVFKMELGVLGTQDRHPHHHIP